MSKACIAIGKSDGNVIGLWAKLVLS